MTESHEQAFDEIGTMLLDAWSANERTECIPIVWGNVVSGKQGAVDHYNNPDPYMRVEIVHQTSRTGSLKGPVGTKREYEGLVAAFLHIQAGKGYIQALPLISVAESAFKGTKSPSGVWFRQPRITNIGLQGTWYVVSMTATFLYDLTT